jgi:hypothetical protein
VSLVDCIRDEWDGRWADFRREIEAENRGKIIVKLENYANVLNNQMKQRKKP